jgi:hypothetical protein
MNLHFFRKNDYKTHSFKTNATNRITRGISMKINLLKASLIILSFIQCGGDSNSNEKPISKGSTINIAEVPNLQELKASFYNSKNFLTHINKYDQKIKEEVSSNIFENSENLEFVKVDVNEAIFSQFSTNFEYSETYITEMFHQSTKYQHYNYEGLDQFEYRRVKSQHEENGKTDQSKLYPRELRFYQKLILPANSIGEYNFNENYYSFDINALSLNQFIELGNCVNNESTLQGFMAGTGLRVRLIIPKSLRLYIKSLHDAEKFSETDKNVTINFVLKPTTIQESGDFIDVETSNLPFTLFKEQLRGELAFENREYEYYAYTTEDLSKAWNLYLNTKIPATADPVEYGISRTVFKRIFLYDIVGEISSINIETEELGKFLWKSNEWFLHQSVREFANLKSADSIFNNISVLLDSAKAIENISPNTALHFLKKVQNSLNRLKEEYPNTAFCKTIENGKEMGGNYNEYTFRKYLIQIERAAGIETSAYAVSMDIIKAHTTEGKFLHKNRNVGKRVVRELLKYDLIDDIRDVSRHFKLKPEISLFELYCMRGESGRALSLFNNELTQVWSRQLLMEAYLIQGKVDSARIIERQLTDYSSYTNHERTSVSSATLVRKIIELYDQYGAEEEVQRVIPLAKKALFLEYERDFNMQLYNPALLTAPKQFYSSNDESEYNKEVVFIGELEARKNPADAISYLETCIFINKHNATSPEYYYRSLIPTLIDHEYFDIAKALDSKYLIEEKYGDRSLQEQLIAEFEGLGVDMSDLSRSMDSILPESEFKGLGLTVGSMLVAVGIDTAKMGESIFSIEKRGIKESELLMAKHYIRKGEIDRAIQFVNEVADSTDDCEVLRFVATICAVLVDVNNTYELIQNPCISKTGEDEGRIIATLVESAQRSDSIDVLNNIIMKYRQYPQVQKYAHFLNLDSIAYRIKSSWSPTTEIRMQVAMLIQGRKPDIAIELINILDSEVDDKIRTRIIGALCEKGDLDLALENLDDIKDKEERLISLVTIGVTQEAIEFQLSGDSKKILKNLNAGFD